MLNPCLWGIYAVYSLEIMQVQKSFNGMNSDVGMQYVKEQEVPLALLSYYLSEYVGRGYT